MACLEAAVITGDIHLQLFTAAAQRVEPSIRNARVTQLAARLQVMKSTYLCAS